MQMNLQLPSGSSLFWHVLWAGLKDGVNPGSGLVMCVLVTLLLAIIFLGKRFVVWAWSFVGVYGVSVFAINFLGIDFIFDTVPVLTRVLSVARYVVAIMSMLLGVIFLRDWYLFKCYGSDQNNVFKLSSLHWTLNEQRFSGLLFIPISVSVVCAAVFCSLLQATWPMDTMMLKIIIKVLSNQFVGFPYVVAVYTLSLGLPLVGLILGMRWLCLVESQNVLARRYSLGLIVLAGFYVAIAIIYFWIFK